MASTASCRRCTVSSTSACRCSRTAISPPACTAAICRCPPGADRRDDGEDDIILIEEAAEESEEDALARAIAEERSLKHEPGTLRHSPLRPAEHRRLQSRHLSAGNPLSVYGANNLGKSASINALQFPILARMSDMSFGKYSLEQSRKFYFASDTSYILVEVMLPHGPHVIGVAGRGPGGGFGHQFFVYQGSLDLDHYQQNGTCLRQRELFANLERAGIRPTRPSRTSCAGCWSAGIPRSRWT